MVMQAFSASASVLKGEPPTYGAPVLIDRTPGCHEAGTSTKAGTAALSKLITNEKLLLVAVHICRSTELMMRLNCMMHPT